VPNRLPFGLSPAPGGGEINQDSPDRTTWSDQVISGLWKGQTPTCVGETRACLRNYVNSLNGTRVSLWGGRSGLGKMSEVTVFRGQKEWLPRKGRGGVDELACEPTFNCRNHMRPSGVTGTWRKRESEVGCNKGENSPRLGENRKGGRGGRKPITRKETSRGLC